VKRLDVHLPGFEPEPAPEPAPNLGPDLGLQPQPRRRDAHQPTADPPDVIDPPVAPVPFTVQVTRSAKRRRSVGAQLVGDTLRLAIPSWMSAAEESHWVDEMGRRFMRKMSTDRIDLPQRAVTLARRFDLPRPKDIRWATDMTTRWGSCTPATGTIRISDRLAPFPDWVVDYIIIHELAHLEVAGHGADFWQLVHRFPTAERAIGYLIAKSGDDE
jgi:predicted metal-dependent hydrolase